MTRNGYNKPVRVAIEVPADMLGLVSGFEGPTHTKRELAWALEHADANDAESLQWLASVLEMRLTELA